jgi:putative transcriptional regulator
MTKKAFDKIAEGLRDAVSIARGELKPAKVFIPPEIDVPGIREKLGLSQENFASVFGFTVHQIRQWEQGRSRPLGAIRAYLMVIDKAPCEIRKILHAKPEKRNAA